MGYTGNKKYHSEPIIDFLNQCCFDDMAYIEPFVGMAHILRRIVNKKSYHASDLSPYISVLLCVLQKYHRFPNITKSVYDVVKNCRNTDVTEIVLERLRNAICDPIDRQFAYNEIEAFAALATPQSKPWNGYQGNKNEGFAHQDYKRLREHDYLLCLESQTFHKTVFSQKDYLSYDDDLRHCVIYCDAPYKRSARSNQRHYGSHVADFDHNQFWDKIRKWSALELGNAVVISEYEAPSDFAEILQFTKKGTFGKMNVEKLFMWLPAYAKWKEYFN